MSVIFGLCVLVSAALPIIAFSAGGNAGAPSGTVTPVIPLSTQVSNIYNFALLLGGLLAFGAVVYGAARYTLSAGSPSAQSDARDQITQALVGLVLLLGAYIVLNTINPSLTSFRLPVLKEIRPAGEATSTLRLPCPTCPAGQICLYRGNTPSCVSLTAPPAGKCDPLNSAGTCPSGKACVLNVTTGETSCK